MSALRTATYTVQFCASMWNVPVLETMATCWASRIPDIINCLKSLPRGKIPRLIAYL